MRLGSRCVGLGSKHVALWGGDVPARLRLQLEAKWPARGKGNAPPRLVGKICEWFVEALGSRSATV